MMYRIVKQTFLVSSGLLMSGVAFAHPSVLHGQGLYYGLLHPITGLDHLLALFAAGLLASRYQSRHAGGMLAMMLLMMATGATIGLFGPTLSVVEIGITGSLLLLGGVIAVGRHLPALVAAGALMIVGMLHGYAHGQEMTPAFNTLLYFAGFLLSSLAIQGLGLLAGRLQQEHGETLYRLGGGLILLSGLGLFGSGLS